MPNAKIKELESVVAKLESERQSHLEAIREIDAAFDKMGISPGAGVPQRGRPGRKPGRPAGAKPGPKPGAKRGRPGRKPGRPAGKPGRKPGRPAGSKPGPKPKVRGRGPTGNRYAVSGTDLVLKMVQDAGPKGIPGANINKVWQDQGRAGTAYNILGKLADDKKIKKQKNNDGRGSFYISA